MSLKKPNPPHPGHVLGEYLKREGVSQAALSREIDFSRQNLNEFIKGRSRMTAQLAVGVAAALGTSAEFWLVLQMRYDLWKARSDAQTRAYLRQIRPLTTNRPAVDVA